jgi:regulator of cell morphogenesis and NO signaling
MRLERIADLTDNHTVPEDACLSYRDMIKRLAAPERDTHEYVHKENNVLFADVNERFPVA